MELSLLLVGLHDIATSCTTPRTKEALLRSTYRRHHLVHGVCELSEVFVGVGQVKMYRLSNRVNAGVCPAGRHHGHVRLEPS